MKTNNYIELCCAGGLQVPFTGTQRPKHDSAPVHKAPETWCVKVGVDKQAKGAFAPFGSIQTPTAPPLPQQEYLGVMVRATQTFDGIV